MKKILFFLLLVLGGLLGCNDYTPPSTEFKKLVEKVNNQIVRAQNQKRAAREGLDKYREFLEKNPDTPFKRDVYYHIISLVFKYLGEDPQLVMEVSRKFVNLFPRDRRTPICLFHMAEIHYYKQDYEKALKYLSRIIKDFPRYTKLNKVYMWKIFITYETTQYKRCLEVCDEFQKKWPNSPLNEKVSRYRKKAGAALKWKGEMVPQIVQKDLLGREINLKNWRGNVVLIVFWGPGKKRLKPKQGKRLEEINHKFGGRNFRLLSVGIFANRNTKEIKKYFRDEVPVYMKSWINTYGEKGLESPVAENFQIDQLPISFLIDPKGKIQGIDVWGEALEKLIGDMLG